MQDNVLTCHTRQQGQHILSGMTSFAVIVLSILVLFLLAGVLPAPGGGQAAVFRTPVFVVLLGVLCTGLTAACTRFRRPAFLMCHLGCTLVLGGAFVGFILGSRGSIVLPLTEAHGVEELPVPGGRAVPLGFRVSAAAFDVEFYPAADGSRQATARHYEADLVFTGPETSRQRLRVNHPVTHGGWRFYLTSYDTVARRYIVVTARRDPGRCLVIPGIWMVIAGTAGLCWFRKRRTTPGGEGEGGR